MRPLNLIPEERDILLSALDDYAERCQSCITACGDFADSIRNTQAVQLRDMWKARLTRTKEVRERVVAPC